MPHLCGLLPLYVFGLAFFLRIVYSNGFYWFDAIPPRAIPTWYYIPEHIILLSPVLAAAALPFLVIYYSSVGKQQADEKLEESDCVSSRVDCSSLGGHVPGCA
jgi:hypothetical protein